MQISPRASRPGKTPGSWTAVADSTCAPQIASFNRNTNFSAKSTTQDFKLSHGRGGLYIGKGVLKNNVFVLDFVPDQGTADSNAIVNFTSWTHPPDLDPDFSPEGFCRRDNIGSSKDNIGSSRDNIGSSNNNYDTNRGSFNGTSSHRRYSTDSCAAVDSHSTRNEADWDEQNVDAASEEVGPLPYCSVDIPMDDENPRKSVNAEVYYDFADNGYVIPQPVDTNVSERIEPNFLPDPEDANLPVTHRADTGTRHRRPRSSAAEGACHGSAGSGGGTQGKMARSHGQRIKGAARAQHLERHAYRSGTQQDHSDWKMGFRVKTKANGTIDKFKARRVVRGFDQEHGRDFTETFAPVSRHTSLQILLAIAAMKRKKLRQINVANAFLYAPVDAEIFVEQPHGSNADPNQVCQLQKSLYGIKQAPRLWQQYLHA
ncbi:unnamed protein product [Closterium sp. NIES-53]